MRDKAVSPRRRLALKAAAAGVAGLWGPAALAQNSGPVTLIVPTSAGGGMDTLARAVAAKLADKWGRPVVVENRTGAGSIIGTEAAVRAKPDGNTLFMGTTNTTYMAALFPKIKFDPAKDLVPITMIASVPVAIAIHPSLKVDTLQEFIAYCKANPGKVNYGSSGVGAILHMSGEYFKSVAGVDITHVPYKGGNEAIAALIGGQLQMVATTAFSLSGPAKTGRVKLLAVTGARRMSQLPDVPTFAEAGLPGFDVRIWYGLMAPAGLPRASIQSIHADVVAAASAADVRPRLEGQGMEIDLLGPAEFDRYFKAEAARYSKVIKERNIVAD